MSPGRLYCHSARQRPSDCLGSSRGHIAVPGGGVPSVPQEGMAPTAAWRLQVRHQAAHLGSGPEHQAHAGGSAVGSPLPGSQQPLPKGGSTREGAASGVLTPPSRIPSSPPWPRTAACVPMALGPETGLGQEGGQPPGAPARQVCPPRAEESGIWGGVQQTEPVELSRRPSWRRWPWRGQ